MRNDLPRVRLARRLLTLAAILSPGALLLGVGLHVPWMPYGPPSLVGPIAFAVAQLVAAGAVGGAIVAGRSMVLRIPECWFLLGFVLAVVLYSVGLPDWVVLVAAAGSCSVGAIRVTAGLIYCLIGAEPDASSPYGQ